MFMCVFDFPPFLGLQLGLLRPIDPGSAKDALPTDAHRIRTHTHTHRQIYSINIDALSLNILKRNYIVFSFVAREFICAASSMSLTASTFTGQAVAFRPVSSQPKQRVFGCQIVAKQSRIGKLPVPVPDKVQVTLEGNSVKVKVR